MLELGMLRAAERLTFPIQNDEFIDILGWKHDDNFVVTNGLDLDQDGWVSKAEYYDLILDAAANAAADFNEDAYEEDEMELGACDLGDDHTDDKRNPTASASEEQTAASTLHSVLLEEFPEHDFPMVNADMAEILHELWEVAGIPYDWVAGIPYVVSNSIDIDGNGHVAYSEFLDWANKLLPPENNHATIGALLLGIACILCPITLIRYCWFRFRNGVHEELAEVRARQVETALLQQLDAEAAAKKLTAAHTRHVKTGRKQKRKAQARQLAAQKQVDAQLEEQTEVARQTLNSLHAQTERLKAEAKEMRRRAALETGRRAAAVADNMETAGPVAAPHPAARSTSAVHDAILNDAVEVAIVVEAVPATAEEDTVVLAQHIVADMDNPSSSQSSPGATGAQEAVAGGLLTHVNGDVMEVAETGTTCREVPTLHSAGGGLSREQQAELANFLQAIGLRSQETKRLLIEHQLGMEALLLCADDDLKEIGVSKGSRVKLNAAMMNIQQR